MWWQSFHYKRKIHTVDVTRLHSPVLENRLHHMKWSFKETPETLLLTTSNCRHIRTFGPRVNSSKNVKKSRDRGLAYFQEFPDKWKCTILYVHLVFWVFRDMVKRITNTWDVKWQGIRTHLVKLWMSIAPWALFLKWGYSSSLHHRISVSICTRLFDSYAGDDILLSFRLKISVVFRRANIFVISAFLAMATCSMVDRQ
jgi:hypothetical protein